MRCEISTITVLIIFLVSSFSDLSAQNKKQLKKTQEADTTYFNLPPEVVIGNHIYKTTYNCLLVGAGKGINSKNRNDNSFGVDYQFHIKKSYFQAGVARFKEDNSNPFVYNRIAFDIHTAYGFKKEDIKMTFAGFAGPSLVTGKNELNHSPYATIGLQIQLQAIYKIYFDVGIGVTAYYSYNNSYSSGGIRLCAFFSNSHKGKLNEYLP